MEEKLGAALTSPNPGSAVLCADDPAIGDPGLESGAIQQAGVGDAVSESRASRS
jgi:hypothetical protein